MFSMIPSQPDLPPRRAAVYVRVSADHQQPAASKQMDVNGDLAKRHGMQMVKEYSDEGRGGLDDQGWDSSRK
jgi:DNA invertase Pin-like site-specific DNA recombinase